jgi:hypothetical protein
VKVRRTHQIVSVAVIVAVGVNIDGRREVLGMTIGHSEAEPFWIEFLRSLARRGVKLVVSDAHEGLASIPGVGVINATALLSAVGGRSAFAKGRDLAAWLGLTPRQHSPGGKTKMLGISKRGNRYLREQLNRTADPHRLRTGCPTGPLSQWLSAGDQAPDALLYYLSALQNSGMRRPRLGRTPVLTPEIPQVGGDARSLG